MDQVGEAQRERPYNNVMMDEMESGRREIPANTISGLLAGFESVGLNTDLMLLALGVPRSQFQDPFGTVPEAWIAQLFDTAFVQDPRPDLPARVGLATPFGAFGLMDYLVGTAESVGEGLVILSLFFHLISDTVRLELEHGDDDSLWFVNHPTAPTDWIRDQWSLGIMQERQTRFCDQFRARGHVYMQGVASETASRFQQLFHAPVSTNAPRSGMVLARGVWNARLRTSDPALHATLKSLAQQVEVKAFQAAPFANVVRTRLPAALQDGQFAEDQVAEQLGLPLRTFQRRLSHEQVSFKQLLDAYRQDIALKMLARQGMTMAQVAHALGYNEQSSFNRAFKRWTGKTPRAWLLQNRPV